MGKITKYLNEHLVGSVVNAAVAENDYSTDGSPLKITPEFVALPKVTNDIRKAVRFSWQLAEKGHVLGVTVRGLGGDINGGALGEGLIVDTSRHLSSVLYIPGKEKKKVVHAEAGISLRTLHEVLRWNGLTLGAFSPDMQDMTVGGAIASGISTYRSGKYGRLADSVERMEVVLSNGDVIEVGEVSKRDVNKKRGEQTLEGEIYRQLDALLDDEAELIDKLSSDNDNIGYSINKIRQKDGTYNLIPLLAGSQGTLGIISEVVLRADYYSSDESSATIALPSVEVAQDLADEARKMSPSCLLLFNSAYQQAAEAHGKKFIFHQDSSDQEGGQQSTVLYVSFDDFGEKARARKIKRLEKIAEKQTGVKFYSSLDSKPEEVNAIKDVWPLVNQPDDSKLTSVTVTDGAYVPGERLRSFVDAVDNFAAKQRVDLPLVIDMLSGVISSRVMLNLNTVSGKQQVFKLLSGYSKLVHEHGGTLASVQAEGRLAALAAYTWLDDDVLALNEKVRKIFDPYAIMNPGVKQKVELKSLVKLLRSSK